MLGSDHAVRPAEAEEYENGNYSCKQKHHENLPSHYPYADTTAVRKSREVRTALRRRLEPFSKVRGDFT